MPKNAIATICEPLASLREACIAEWLVKFCAMFDKSLTPLLKATWCEALADLDAGMIEAACLHVSKTAEFFPSPGTIRKCRDQADARGFELVAAQKWQQLLAWIGRWYHPDVGVNRRAPELDAAIQFAARSAGGFHWISTCPESELNWARKRFIEDYGRIHEAGQAEHLLSDGEAKNIITRLRAGPPEQKRMAASGAKTLAMSMPGSAVKP